MYLAPLIYLFLESPQPCIAPSKGGASKNEQPTTANDSSFLMKNLFHSQNGNVYKYIELNMIRFDRDRRVLS